MLTVMALIWFWNQRTRFARFKPRLYNRMQLLILGAFTKDFCDLTRGFPSIMDCLPQSLELG